MEIEPGAPHRLGKVTSVIFIIIILLCTPTCRKMFITDQYTARNPQPPHPSVCASSVDCIRRLNHTHSDGHVPSKCVRTCSTTVTWQSLLTMQFSQPVIMHHVILYLFLRVECGILKTKCRKPWQVPPNSPPPSTPLPWQLASITEASFPEEVVIWRDAGPFFFYLESLLN